MLWPLRAELDVPDRTRVLLPLRTGRVLRAHLIVPATVTAVGAAAGAAAAPLTGPAAGPAAGAAAALITGHESAVIAVIAIATTPPLTLCAAMSARRGGR